MLSNQESYSPFICASFAANYIIGTGFLALPWAFYQAGWLLSIVCLAVVCWAESVASDYVLSALARAEWLLLKEERRPQSEQQHLRDNQEVVFPLKGDGATTIGHRNGQPQHYVQEQQQIKQSGYGSIQVHNQAEVSTLKQQPQSLLAISNTTNHHLDLPDVCQPFLNRAGYSGYMVCVHLYLYGSLWMFTSVFGNAVATYFDDIPYTWAVMALAAVGLPLSCLQLTEQKLLQVILTASRILLMVLMVVTPLVAAVTCATTQCSHFGSSSEVLLQEEEREENSAPWLDWSGVYRMLPIVVCAAIFHFSIPALAMDLGGSNKDQLGQVFGWTFVLVFLVYASIGVVDAWYFGGNIQQSSNVNWSHYHGGTGRAVVVDGKTFWVDVALWAKAISFFVTMFPAINVTSVFPLHALVLGNSLMAIWYQDRIQEVEQNRWIISAFRVVAAAPPLIGGLFVRELGTIIDYNGIFGLAIAFVFPPWLYLASVQRCPTTRTCYERLGSSYAAAMSLLIFGMVSQVTVLSLLVWRG